MDDVTGQGTPFYIYKNDVDGYGASRGETENGSSLGLGFPSPPIRWTGIFTFYFSPDFFLNTWITIIGGLNVLLR